MIHALSIIFGCLFIGEIIVHYSGIQMPSSIVGMLTLLILLCVKGRVTVPLDHAARTFMTYIGLLFVPAGAGISLYLHVIVEQWLVIAIVCASLVISLVTTAHMFALLERNNDESTT